MNKGQFGLLVLTLGVAMAGSVAAKAPGGVRPDGGEQRYIVVFGEEPLAAWHARGAEAGRNSPEAVVQGKGAVKGARGRLDVSAPEARAYLDLLEQDYQRLHGAAERSIGRKLSPVHRYRNALNGISVTLTAAEARRIAGLPGVKRVEVDRVSRPDTDSGPRWIGADEIWNGEGNLPATRGQGVVIGVIDSGINTQHLSFADPGQDGGGWNHVNPFGQQLGLCGDPGVECNDKLVGVYEFVTNDPGTEVEEEPNQGLDNSGHGSHVASIAAGNPVNLNINGVLRQISGVAPNANIVSYRVCYVGDPEDFEDDGCQTSAILAAIEQAITDGVDVINYSIGSPGAFSPWAQSSVPEAFLNAFGAGIFVATSTGNLGPEAGSVNSPANAPWITSVGYATHNRVLANLLENLVGGDTPPPGDLVGASFTDGTDMRPIVHGKDFGSALCGMGPPELQPDCDGNTGASNPFPPGTFNGEIVVCDRGEYGRVEKGKNLLEAGAGGYILANTEEHGESIVADDHCLPATHIAKSDGDLLRTWLDGGEGHMGRISGFDIFEIDAAGDQVSSGSSRGPNLPPAENVLKPNLIAPGVTIVGASEEGSGQDSGFVFLSGSSMSSPHVAGAAALLLAVDESWTPSMVSSTLELTATAEQAVDFDNLGATPFERGSGRPRIGDAANSGLFLGETLAGFELADPDLGGDPGTLNLPGLVETDCQGTCSFTRTVTAITPNLSWTASPAGFPAGVEVTISPDQFMLADAGEQTLEIDIDLEGAGQTGQWVYGDIRLSASGAPDSVMTVAVFASGGELPPEWNISSDRDSGWQQFGLDGLVVLNDATYNAGGLVRPQVVVQALPEDPTNDQPYDGGSGVYTVLLDVPEGALWLHTETLDSTAPDIDLYVGRDTNGDGVAQESEQVCSSITPEDIELCDIFTPPAGTWWVLVQNWTGSASPTDDATLVSAVIPGDGSPGISATGPGIVDGGESFQVRVAWDDVAAVPGEELLGAVGIGTSRDHPNNIGVVPVRFTRTGISGPRTLPLAPGLADAFALAGNAEHDRVFIDIPPGAQSLTVAASGADADQNDGLAIDLVHMDFDSAFVDAPFTPAAPNDPPVISSSGSGGQGPVATLSGAQLQPGRWYAVIRNTTGSPSSVEVSAGVEFGAAPIPIRGGLWQHRLDLRGAINQGYEYTEGGASRAFIWYTYGEDGTPAWYLAANLSSAGNIWAADLLRFTNDGAQQQYVKVGRVIITMLDEVDSIFSFSLFGESGSDRMVPSALNTCPTIEGAQRSLIGLWFRGLDGLGGASVLYNATAHVQIHYLYGASGNPRWLLAGGPDGNNMSLLQFSGSCAVCEQGASSSEAVGATTFDFASELTGIWSFDFMFLPPLEGAVNRAEDIFKLTDILGCQ